MVDSRWSKIRAGLSLAGQGTYLGAWGVPHVPTAGTIRRVLDGAVSWEVLNLK